MGRFLSIMKLKLDELSASEKKIITEVWEHRAEFVQRPAEARLLWEGCVRVKYHTYPDEIKRELKRQGIALDSRSNGPAIMSFLLARGERPNRADSTKGWSIHHIYNGKFPFIEGGKTLHAVKDGTHFTQSAGLAALHPIAHALADEYFYFVWLLRQESFLRFNYDPDMVFCKKIDEYGFKTSRAHENVIEQKLMNLGYEKISRSKWTKGNRVVHAVRSSKFGRRIRITWREEWKDDYAIIYDYSDAQGPVYVVPIPVFFMSGFVKEKRRTVAYKNSGYWWTQTFLRDHELAKLVLSFEGRWDTI